MPPPSVATPQIVGVVVANTTGRPELAVPVMVKGVALQVRLPRLANVIVWLALVTLKLCVTCVAAL